MFEKSMFIARCRVWRRVAVIALTLFLTSLVVSSSLAPLVTHAAPPAQDPTTNQIERVRTVFRNLGFVEGVRWLTGDCPNTKELRFRVITSTPFFDLKPGGEYVEVCVYVFPPESANTVPNLFDQEYAAMGTRMSKSGWMPKRFTIGNVDAAVIEYGGEAQRMPINTGPWYYSGTNKGILTCGTVFLDMILLQLGGLETEADYAKRNRQMEQMIPRSKEWMQKMTSALQAAGACSAASPVTPTPTRTATPTQAAGAMGVGHGCSYDEFTISTGQLRCAATFTNALPNATIEYAWKLDGNPQPEKGNTFTREDKDIAPGTHTLIVVAKDTKNNKEASSSFNFIKPGGAMSVTAQCAVRADNASAVTCYADVQDAPAGAALTYEWTWNNAPEGETSRTLNKTGLKDGSYTITVRAKDSVSGKTAQANTTVLVGSTKTGALNIKTSGGTQTLKPGDKVRILLSPNERLELIAACMAASVGPEMAAFTFRDSYHLKPGFFQLRDAVFSFYLAFMLCDQLVFAPPYQLASAGFLDHSGARADMIANLPVQLEIELEEGAIQFDVTHNKVALDVKTTTTTVSSEGKNTFGVEHDPDTNVTYVTANEGTVTVQPQNRALAPVALQKGQQVQVTKESVSPVTAIPASGATTSALAQLAPLAIGGCVGLIALLGLIGGVLIIARGRTRPARPSALPPSAPEGRARPTDLPR